ncbi:hypothetical protein ABFV99_13295 [Cytobacillus horneckiae]|uniref:hypothetical protein n=1 Tax=Cytobacillus horneckiae TaxID=549687 RepID=UPI0034CEFA18
MGEKVIYDNGSSQLLVNFDGEIVRLDQETEGEIKNQIFLYKDELENAYDFVKGNTPSLRNELIRLIARNLVAWDTSKDKREGLLPEVYLTNKYWYKQLTGEEYFQHKAVEKFNIE